MHQQPATKYRAFPAIDLPQRQWPARTITQPRPELLRPRPIV